MKCFYVIQAADSSIQSLLDALVRVCEPERTHPAHVTVRGPYDRPQTPHTIESWNEGIRGAELTLLGLGDFFREEQNTVHLCCRSPQVEALWWKPDFTYTPHLTLYDGPSRAFAQRLRDGLGEQWQAVNNLHFENTELRELRSGPGTDAFRASERQRLLASAARQLRGIDPAQLDQRERCALAAELLGRLMVSLAAGEGRGVDRPAAPSEPRHILPQL